MSTMGGFSWEPADVRTRRVRIVAATALLAAGWATGFFAGRMSAWLFPVAPNGTTVEKVAAHGRAVPGRPPQAAAGRDRKADRSGQPEPRSAPVETKQPSTAAPSLAAQDAAAPPGGRQGEAAPPAEEAGPQAEDAGPAATLINPDWAKARPAPRRRQAEAEAGSDRNAARNADRAVAECERRYASFRRSDGTYQPYGDRPRELCPMLR
jgi:hypothetical protein